MQSDGFALTGGPRVSSLALAAVMGAGLLVSGSAYGELHFWDNEGPDTNYTTGSNWDPDTGTGGPGAADLAVHDDGSLPPLEITSDVTADSLRFSNGGAATHTSGTLTIESGQGPDDGLWVGEFGPAQSSYTLDGGTIQINDKFDGLQVGRSSGSDGVFNFESGMINQAEAATPGGGDDDPLGATIIGLDGTAEWNQSGGTFDGDLVQVGLFQSPGAELNLSGDATFDAATAITISEGAANEGIDGGESTMSVTGSDVDVSALSFKVLGKGNLAFTADASGVSTIHQTDPEGVFEMGAPEPDNNDAPGLDVDLSALDPGVSEVTLIDAEVPLNENVDGTLFDGLAEGATVPGTDGGTITYSGGPDGNDVVLEGLSSLLLGDMNGDGEVNNLDINPFVLALTDEDAFEEQFGTDPATVGDINEDGQLNNLDINPFVSLLTDGSSLQSVPEPTSLALLLGGAGLVTVGRRRRTT